MSINTIPRLKPVSTSGPLGEAALLVDEAASPETLYGEAESRLMAAKGMLFTAAISADAQGLEGNDVHNIAQAAQILTSDAMDLVRALHSAHLRTNARQQRAPQGIHHFGHGQGE